MLTLFYRLGFLLFLEHMKALSLCGCLYLPFFLPRTFSIPFPLLTPSHLVRPKWNVPSFPLSSVCICLVALCSWSQAFYTSSRLHQSTYLSCAPIIIFVVSVHYLSSLLRGKSCFMYALLVTIFLLQNTNSGMYVVDISHLQNKSMNESVPIPSLELFLLNSPVISSLLKPAFLFSLHTWHLYVWNQCQPSISFILQPFSSFDFEIFFPLFSSL